MPLIPADQDFAVFTAIMVIAGIAFLSERTWLGQKVTGTVVVILLAILAANTGAIPHSAPAYGFIFGYIVPVLIPLFYSKRMFDAWPVKPPARPSPFSLQRWVLCWVSLLLHCY